MLLTDVRFRIVVLHHPHKQTHTLTHSLDVVKQFLLSLFFSVSLVVANEIRSVRFSGCFRFTFQMLQYVCVLRLAQHIPSLALLKKENSFFSLIFKKSREEEEEGAEAMREKLTHEVKIRFYFRSLAHLPYYNLKWREFRRNLDMVAAAAAASLWHVNHSCTLLPATRTRPSPSLSLSRPIPGLLLTYRRPCARKTHMNQEWS